MPPSLMTALCATWGIMPGAWGLTWKNLRFKLKMAFSSTFGMFTTLMNTRQDQPRLAQPGVRQYLSEALTAMRRIEVSWYSRKLR